MLKCLVVCQQWKFVREKFSRIYELENEKLLMRSWKSANFRYFKDVCCVGGFHQHTSCVCWSQTSLCVRSSALALQTSTRPDTFFWHIFKSSSCWLTFQRFLSPLRIYFCSWKATPFERPQMFVLLQFKRHQRRNVTDAAFKSWLLGATLEGWFWVGKECLSIFGVRFPEKFHYSHWNEAKTWYGRGG